jgi:hypothetical protein
MQIPGDAIHTAEASIDVSASPEVLFDMVSDIVRMGEWSPEATGGHWLDGGSGEVGDWFMGDNTVDGRDWSRACQVAKADRGQDFTFVIGGFEANCTWWSYEFEPVDAGTRVTERWWMVNLTPGMQGASPEQRTQRVESTQPNIDRTLAQLKEVAERRA